MDGRLKKKFKCVSRMELPSLSLCLSIRSSVPFHVVDRKLRSNLEFLNPNLNQGLSLSGTVRVSGKCFCCCWRIYLFLQNQTKCIKVYRTGKSGIALEEKKTFSVTNPRLGTASVPFTTFYKFQPSQHDDQSGEPKKTRDDHSPNHPTVENPTSKYQQTG